MGKADGRDRVLGDTCGDVTSEQTPTWGTEMGAKEKTPGKQVPSVVGTVALSSAVGTVTYCHLLSAFSVPCFVLAPETW